MSVVQSFATVKVDKSLFKLHRGSFVYNVRYLECNPTYSNYAIDSFKYILI